MRRMGLGLDRLSWHGQIATFFLVAVAGFVVFEVYRVVIVRGDTSLAEQDVAQLQVEIDEALQSASQAREVETDVDNLTGCSESFAAALPQERDAPALLRRLQTLAAPQPEDVLPRTRDGETVFFDASAFEPGPGRTTVSYSWNFGDGVPRRLDRRRTTSSTPRTAFSPRS